MGVSKLKDLLMNDFTFTRENNPNNKNSFYSLKDGKLEIIVVPVEEE